MGRKTRACGMALSFGGLAPVGATASDRSKTGRCRDHHCQPEFGYGGGGCMNSVITVLLVLLAVCIGTYCIAVIQHLVLLGPRRVGAAFVLPVALALTAAPTRKSRTAQGGLFSLSFSTIHCPGSYRLHRYGDAAWPEPDWVQPLQSVCSIFLCCSVLLWLR